MIRTSLVSAVALAAVGGAFVAGRATLPGPEFALASQPEGMDQPSPDQIRQMIEAGAAKAPDHDHLQHLVGKWDATVNFLTAPGAEPEVSKMTAEIKPVLDGRYVLSHYSGSFKYMGADIPFEGYGMLGYDKAQSHFTSAWGDNMSTSMLIQTGDFEDGAIDVKGEMPDGMGGMMPMRHRHVLNEDGSYTLEFFQPNPMTGEMAKIGWIDHAKK